LWKTTKKKSTRELGMPMEREKEREREREREKEKEKEREKERVKEKEKKKEKEREREREDKEKIRVETCLREWRTRKTEFSGPSDCREKRARNQSGPRPDRGRISRARG
jgi:hypothetical protein